MLKSPFITSTSTASAMHIRTYQKADQEAVIELVLNIQQQEFGVDISRSDQPDLLTVPAHYQQGSGQFWVAEQGGEVIGTLGLLDIGQQTVALRKMFVAQEFRGGTLGVAQQLMLAALDWCQQQAINGIYLGTIHIYQAAIRFYQKNGFLQVPREQLPESFPLIAVDDVFFYKRITELHQE